MKRQPGSNLGVAQPYRPPVDLSGTRTDHGSHRAYNHYRCRCEPCVEFRRSYERDRWELTKLNVTQAVKVRASRSVFHPVEIYAWQFWVVGPKTPEGTPYVHVEVSPYGYGIEDHRCVFENKARDEFARRFSGVAVERVIWIPLRGVKP